MNKIFIISKYTFSEIYKGKILFNILFLGLALVLLTYVASEFTFGSPQKIALDIGIGSLSLSSVGISLFFGSTLITKEIESRTIYMLLSKPLSRSQFILGRLLGISGILFLNNLILAILTLTMFFILGGQYESLIAWSVLFAFFEAFIVLLVVVAFSLVSNLVITVLCSIWVYIIGHGIGAVLNLKLVQGNELLTKFIQGYKFFFPDFSKLNIKQFLLYKQDIDSSYLFNTTGYFFGYSLALVFLILLIFQRKELD